MAGNLTTITHSRRIRLLWPSDHLVCPGDHKVKEDAIVIEHGGLRCKYKVQQQRYARAVECGLWLWLLQPPHSHYRIIAEVTLTELRHMQTVGMDIETARAFLGLNDWLRTAG